MQLPIPFFDSLTAELPQQLTAHTQSYVFTDDLTQASEFLAQYQSNSATFNAYRRELERLLQWSALIAKKPLAALVRDDLENFIYFCKRPPKTWIALNKSPRFIQQNGARVPNPTWRPFVVNVPKHVASLGKQPTVDDYSLSEKALTAIFAILNSFFNYLVQINHLTLNPFHQIRQKTKYFRRQQNLRVMRRLSELQWSYVIETIEQLATINPKYERTLFIVSCLYGMYLRISELAYRSNWLPKMGDFFRDHDGLWWFKTVGKGNKERDISVSQAMLVALKRYRCYLKLPPTPAIGEQTPLLFKENSKLPLTSTRQIRDIVQMAFDKAIERLKADGFSEESQQLQAATVHWLRHTGISDDVKIRPREHVRDDAGHASSITTDKYIDVEKRQRHATAYKKKLVPD